MLSTRKVWLGLIAAAAAMLTAVSGAQNFPLLGGDNARTGKNSNPAIYGPGIANVVWFWPNDLSPGNRASTLLRDNPSNATVRINGVPIPQFAWTQPSLTEEAAYFYQASRVFPNPGGALNDQNGATTSIGITSGYEYVRSTPASPNTQTDPTTAPNPANIATFTWNLDPAQEAALTGAGTSAFYQLYVWIPNGPTGPIGGPYVYPNRFYVYEILYGNGRRWIDVIDTNVSGQGWVRLGNGGRATNQIFAYTGNPIQIRLYNTQILDQLNQTVEDNTVPRVVYADAAMAVPDRGSFTATPIVSQIDTGAGLRTQVISSLNANSSVTVDGRDTTITNAVVQAFQHDGLGGPGNPPIWTWSPIEVSPFTTTLDNNDANVDPAWESEAITNHFGADYRSEPIINNPLAATAAVYSPTLDDGDYVIQVYCGGDQGAEQFGTGTRLLIREGLTTTEVPIDQSVAGWVTVGTRRWLHRGSVGDDLRVEIRNYSLVPSDVGKKAYADQIRFIGAYNESINATPVQTRAFVRLSTNAVVERDVVVVASDDGHIYCLDATGNGNGTTTLYWAYPSIMPDNIVDPNASAAEEGDNQVVLANMPNEGFGKSSPLVQRINGVDYCYVASRNGRVYCIEMTGRGDYNAATGRVGTTRRQWSFPDDFPAFERDPLQGGFGGSVTFATTAQGPTIFVPANEGRIYALDALGNANKTTTTRWMYPQRTTQNLGPITTTPTVDFGRVYFGTARLNDLVPGQFYALNMNTGLVDWVFEGTPAFPADNFLGGPCTAAAAQLGVAENMVFCSNQNLFVYGLNADTGALIWSTDELNSGVDESLMFTIASVPDTTGTNVATPVVMVPTQDGRWSGLFARLADLNLDGRKLAWEYLSPSDAVTSMSNGWNFMYGADGAGNLFAWGNVAAVGGLGTPPGSQTLVPNDPLALEYRGAKVTLLSRQGYQLLRQSSPADPEGDWATVSYSAFFGNANNFRQPPGPGQPHAFEWGETAYLLVHDFPFREVDQNNNPVAPPVVQFQIGVEGASVRQYGVQAKMFLPPPTHPTDPDLEGYAILAFPIQGSGPTSIPPGSATVKFSFSTAAVSNNGQVRNVSSPGSLTFYVANPIGIITPNPVTGQPGVGPRSFATSTDPSLPDRRSNGSRLNPTLGESQGVVGHGQTGLGSFWVVDMSMMTLLRGPNRGLEQVRVTRPDFAWQGGQSAVFKQIDQILYPGFEDLPVNFPNTSLDYPDIGRENLAVTKDPLGTPENALVSPSGVSLFPPNPYNEADIRTRVTHSVLFEVAVDVPRFQPMNNYPLTNYFTESGGESIPSGYLARLSVYVDSNGNSQLDNVSGRREAFRALTSSLAVALDDRVVVTTPTVDLGTLPQGAGFSPLAPGTNDGKSLSPWLTGSATFAPGVITSNTGDYVNIFRPLTVQNPGNANLLDMRVAKGVVGGSTPGPWPIYSDAVDDMGWLDGSVYVWTNFDSMYGLMPRVLLQKARVGDRNPTELSINPTRRYNQNLGIPDSLLFPNGPTGEAAEPRIAVSLPIGQPVGLYSQRMHVIEDSNLDEFVSVNNVNSPLETMSNPTFDLKFGVREFRVTNGFTKTGAPVVDYPQAAVNTRNVTYSNQQPDGMRLPNGTLVTVWTSSQPGFGAAVPTDPITDPDYRLFIATLPGQSPSSAAGTSPLRDLRWFGPATNDRWMRREVGPFPPVTTNFDALFQSVGSETVIGGSPKFGGAAFPSMGQLNPLGGPNFNSTIMAFLGSAQKQSGAGRNSEYRIMIATVSVDAAGAVTIDNLQAMPFDPNTPKSRPSLYQVSNGATIFYSGSGTGQGQLFYTITDGTSFARPEALSVGDGFEEVSSPNVQLRLYDGVGGGSRQPRPIVELSFIGKLRGRPNSEVFYGRMLTAPGLVNNNPVDHKPGTPLYLMPRAQEVLTPDTEAGTYRALGVAWNTQQAQMIRVYQSINGGAPVDLEVDITKRTVDRASGLIRTDSRLGGQMYIDPNLGTVRFTSSAPLRNAQILLDYTPRFLRVSESNVAGHASPNVLWDNRIVGDVGPFSYWFQVASNGTVSNLPGNATPRSARYVHMYTRAASGAGQAARPYWKSVRLGVQLPTAIYTDAGGNIATGDLNIQGTSGPVQVDPASGRVYFQTFDEDRVVSIVWRTVDEATGQPGPLRRNNFNVQLIVERSEAPVPIDQAVNEASIRPFIDPFENGPRRPGLIWMHFVSTRTGGPDVYFQTVAPRFSPVVRQ